MLIIVKQPKHQRIRLIIHRDIFPRPTPFKIIYAAFWTFLCRRQSYQFIMLPPPYSKLNQYDLNVEGRDLVLCQHGREVHRTPLLLMSWWLWLNYDFEGYFSTALLKFWNWRWNPKRQTERIDGDD